jgi:hypothetical protein
MSSLPMNKITQTVMTPAAHAHFHHFIDNPPVRSGKIPVGHLPTHQDLPYPDCRQERGSWSPWRRPGDPLRLPSFAVTEDCPETATTGIPAQPDVPADPTTPAYP